MEYLRADVYTTALCSGLNDVRPYLATGLNKTVTFYSEQIQPHLPVKAQAFHPTTTSYTYIANNAADLCQVFNNRATLAADKLEFLIQNPNTIVETFKAYPNVDVAGILNSTLFTVSVYFLVLLGLYIIASFFWALIYNGFIVGFLGLGGQREHDSSRVEKPSLFLFAIETFGLEKMKKEWGVSAEEWYEKHLHQFHQSEENAQFVKRVHLNSGLATGDDVKTHLPPQVTKYPPDQSIKSSRDESFLYITTLLQQIFDRFGIKPTDVDVLVINCSLFNPTPSHCSMAVNHFKMRNDIITYNIAGMGCSASAFSVNACRDALACHPKKNPIGIVISFENLTLNFYHGKERSMLVSNALFRLGAAAMVFGRKPTNTFGGKTVKALYEMEHLLRTTIASNDEAYRCIWQEEDNDGHRGVRLSKDVPKIAGRALTVNLTALATTILPYRVLFAYVLRRAWYKLQGKKDVGSPNFLSAVDHVCIHAGGRGVIDTIQQHLSLPDHIVKPSRDILYQYGNQSSASIWYIFKHLHNDVKKNQKVLQLTFGSGFKTNSLIWRRL